ncbi:Transporter, major facilitator family protein [Aphelenchoides bicaudatus]|nr:Transporter, major facilitator family protein [Aphelenchoides bicaudatus]
MKFEDLVVNHLGEFGLYQKVQFLLVCLPAMFTAMHALSWTFTAAHSDYRCLAPGENSQTAVWKATDQASCFHPYPLNNTKCEQFVYDRRQIHNSALQRWDIVCDQAILKAIIQSAYYVGQMLGSIVFGYLGDKIGRKKVFFIAIITLIIAGLCMSIAPHWSVFMFLRAATGFAHPGIFVIAVVIGVELVGPKKRKIASVFTGIFFSIGQIILGVVAFLVRDYQYLQLAIAAPALAFISYWWLIPESARWLVSQQRYQEADKVLRRAARWNKSSLPDRWWEEIDESASAETTKKNLVAQPKIQKRSYGFLDLLRTPRMRKISLSIFVCWPIVSMVYYGVSMNTTFLGGDPYYTFVLGALMEIPAVLAVFFLVDVIGRKALLAGGFTIASLALISSLFIDGEKYKALAIAQFLIAKSSITGTYATIYTFTPELFPTVIRNTAMGICSMMARLGAILASYIAMWLVDVFGKVAMVVPFSICGLIAAVVIIFLLPETKGRNLTETIEELEGSAQQFELQPLTTQQGTNKAD